MRRALVVASVTALLCVAGCDGTGVDATYGRTRGASVNGTGALAELFRERGDEVRVAVRLNEEVGAWAETIVRFAPFPGPPELEEANWYLDWLAEDPDRRLIYIPFDYHAESEFWARMLSRLPDDAPKDLRERAEKWRDDRKDWPDHLPNPARSPAAPDEWFATDKKTHPAAVVTQLGGPWAEGIDLGAASLTRHDVLVPSPDAEILLTGDGEPLAFAPPGPDSGESQVLVVANGSFLLNLPLVEKARRPLAARVVEFAGPPPRRVVFVESRRPTAPGQDRPPSIFNLLDVEPFGRIAAHLAVFGLLACLAAAARLGRPRPEASSGADRPAAHAEALGDLLARTRDVEAARRQIEEYRRWRHVGTEPPP